MGLGFVRADRARVNKLSNQTLIPGHLGNGAVANKIGPAISQLGEENKLAMDTGSRESCSHSPAFPLPFSFFKNDAVCFLNGLLIGFLIVGQPRPVLLLRRSYGSLPPRLFMPPMPSATSSRVALAMADLT